MKLGRLFQMIAVFCTAFSTASFAQTLAVRGATIINPAGTDIEHGTVIIRGGKIVAVGRDGSISIPKGAQVMDGTGRYLMPGLIDAHVHFWQSGGLFARPDSIDMRMQRSFAAETAITRAKIKDTLHAYTKAGVLGVVDFGGPMWNFEIRKAAQRDRLAPQVWASGPLLSPFQPPALVNADPPILDTVSVDAARRQVRAQLRYRPDFLKFWYVVRNNDVEGPRLRLRAMIDEGRKAGVRSAVHATDLAVARIAVDEGAYVLVHVVRDKVMDDKLLADMKRKGVFVTTTLLVSEGYRAILTRQSPLNALERRLGQPHVVQSYDSLSLYDPPANAADRVRRIAQGHSTEAENLRRMVRAGIPVAMGTDAGNPGTLHALAVADEMAAMADAGMSSRQVLASATVVPARMLRRPDLGRVEKGASADLVLLRRDPRKDVRAIASVAAVIRGGRLVPNAGLPDVE